jgi:hypothetical protein
MGRKLHDVACHGTKPSASLKFQGRHESCAHIQVAPTRCSPL